MSVFSVNPDNLIEGNDKQKLTISFENSCKHSAQRDDRPSPDRPLAETLARTECGLSIGLSRYCQILSAAQQ